MAVHPEVHAILGHPGGKLLKQLGIPSFDDRTSPGIKNHPNFKHMSLKHLKTLD